MLGHLSGCHDLSRCRTLLVRLVPSKPFMMSIGDHGVPIVKCDREAGTANEDIRFSQDGHGLALGSKDDMTGMDIRHRRPS